MHVLLYHDAVVPPRKYGGTERFVSWLAKGLIAQGQKVTVIARPGSALPGAQVIACPRERANRWHELIPSDVDILHLNATPSGDLRRPYLVTIHGNGKPGERFHPNTVFLSKKHAENHGSSHFIHHGIDAAEYPFGSARTRELVFLAKARWKVKNLAGAIEIARAARAPLNVIGSRDWPLGMHRLLPRWRGVRYLGMLGDEEKKNVLGRSRALLFPVRWPEPFGISLLEAMASGCWVLGSPYGSLPEIVTPDVGVLSDRADVLVKALLTRGIPPERCREHVMNQFSHLSMARKYIECYESILRQGSLAPASGDRLPNPEPRAKFTESPETLLPWVSL